MRDQTSSSCPCKRLPLRYLLVILGHCGILLAYAMRANLSIGLVAMVNSSYVQERFVPQRRLDSECDSSLQEILQNHTKKKSMPMQKIEVFNWDEEIQGHLVDRCAKINYAIWTGHDNSNDEPIFKDFRVNLGTVLGAFFYGYIITQIPGGMAATQFGGKWVFGIGIFITSVLTILTPFAARYSVHLLVAVRVVEGLAEGVTFPAMHAILAKWAPLYEKTRLASLIYSGTSFGTLIAYPIAGILCNSGICGGWPSVFYIFGGIGVLWFILWSFLMESSPEFHPRISTDELKYILRHRGPDNSNQKPKIPWKKMLTSGPVFGILITSCCSNWTFYTFLTCLPMYFKEVLNFSIKENGFLSALPILACFLFTIISAEISDYLRRNRKLSTVAVRKLFTCIGMFTASALLSCSGYIGCNQIVVAVAFVTLANGFLCLVHSGASVNHLDIAPKFAGVLQGITNSAGAIPGMFSPMVVGFFTENKPTRGQWQKVFFIAAAVSFLGGLSFIVLGSGKEQSWSAQATVVSDEESVIGQAKPLIQ